MIIIVLNHISGYLIFAMDFFGFQACGMCIVRCEPMLAGHSSTRLLVKNGGKNRDAKKNSHQKMPVVIVIHPKDTKIWSFGREF